MTPALGSSEKSKITEYKDVRGYILFRKPADIRIIGLYPVVRNKAFDMVSNGKDFRLYLPSQNRFVVGSNSLATHSKNKIENLRPQHFLEALLVSPMQPGEKAELINLTDEDNAVYILHFVRVQPNGDILPTRSVWFNRINMHLARQLVYDPEGNILTDARYSEWQKYDNVPFPKVIDIARPQDDYAVVLTVVKMEINRGVPDDKFVLEQPEGTQLQVLGQPAPPAPSTRPPTAESQEEEKTVTVRLVLENLKHKPMRSLLSMFLIAVPVTLILCLVGLSEGMLADSARRARGIGADIVVRPPGTSVLTLSGAPIPEKLVDIIAQQPHVAQAMGMIVHPVSSVSFVSGIDMAAFNRMSGGFKYLEGGPFQGPDDIIVDEYYAQQHKLHAGQKIYDVLNHPWRISGVAEGGKLSRLAVPMRTLQDLTGNTNKISQIFVKVDKPANIPVVIAELKDRLKDYNIYSMEEFTSLLTVQNVQGGALSTFINVMVGIGVVIGFAVVLLSMYMAVLQRTREIGILKALGASRWFILKIILAEALIMGIGGTVVGIGLSFVARALIHLLYPASLTQAVTPLWWPIVAAISLAGVLLGALYPGLSAAAQDPIEALAYE